MTSKTQSQAPNGIGPPGMSTSGTALGALEQQLFDRRRFPVLSGSGRALLLRMRQHPAAPHFRDFSGHRLDAI